MSKKVKAHELVAVLQVGRAAAARGAPLEEVLNKMLDSFISTRSQPTASAFPPLAAPIEIEPGMWVRHKIIGATGQTGERSYDIQGRAWWTITGEKLTMRWLEENLEPMDEVK
mgnify:CR=1 FL=1